MRSIFGSSIMYMWEYFLSLSKNNNNEPFNGENEIIWYIWHHQYTQHYKLKYPVECALHTGQVYNKQHKVQLIQFEQKQFVWCQFVEANYKIIVDTFTMCDAFIKWHAALLNQFWVCVCVCVLRVCYLFIVSWCCSRFACYNRWCRSLLWCRWQCWRFW